MVNLMPVSDFIDMHGRLIIQCGINCPVISLANAIPFLGREFFGSPSAGDYQTGIGYV